MIGGHGRERRVHLPVGDGRRRRGDRWRVGGLLTPSVHNGSISLPGSFAPGLNDQVINMHRQFQALAVPDDKSIATVPVASPFPSASGVTSGVNAPYPGVLGVSGILGSLTTMSEDGVLARY